MTTAVSALRTGTPQAPPTDRVLRVSPFAVRAADPGAPDADGLTLDGYAAVFNRETLIDSWEGRFWEKLAPGSMRRSFRELIPKMQFDHGTHPMVGSMPIATVRSVAEDTDPVLAPEGGAHVVARLFDNWLIQPVRDAIAAEAINGMSFRMRVLREEWAAPDGSILRDPEAIEKELFRSWWEDVPDNELLHRTLQEVRVPELGPVVWPAYTETSVGVRSDGRVVIDLAAARAGSAEERRKIAAIVLEVDKPSEGNGAGGTLAPEAQGAQEPPAATAEPERHNPPEPPDAQEPPAPPESHNPSTRRNADIALDRIRAALLRFPDEDPTSRTRP